jgi:hypothetical protein
LAAVNAVVSTLGRSAGGGMSMTLPSDRFWLDENARRRAVKIRKMMTA